jgi:hypothetical protein
MRNPLGEQQLLPELKYDYIDQDFSILTFILSLSLGAYRFGFGRARAATFSLTNMRTLMTL